MTFRALISFHYFRAQQLDEWAATFPNGLTLFGDSGAYSARSLGADVNLRDYLAWLTRWSELLHVYSNLDVIHNAPATARNLRAMHTAGFNPLPVFHAREDFKVLRKLCAEYRYVALGGMVGAPAAISAWLLECFRIAERTGTMFHGFGQTKYRVLMMFPFYSVDSTSWATGGQYGQMHLWNPATMRFQGVRYATTEVSKHGRLIRAHGGDPRVLAHRSNHVTTADGDQIPSYVALNGVSAVGWTRFARYLKRRWGPLPMDGDEPGPHLYLANGAPGILHYAATFIDQWERTNP